MKLWAAFTKVPDEDFELWDLSAFGFFLPLAQERCLTCTLGCSHSVGWLSVHFRIVTKYPVCEDSNMSKSSITLFREFMQYSGRDDEFRVFFCLSRPLDLNRTTLCHPLLVYIPNLHLKLMWDFRFRNGPRISSVQWLLHTVGDDYSQS